MSLLIVFFVLGIILLALEIVVPAPCVGSPAAFAWCWA